METRILSALLVSTVLVLAACGKKDEPKSSPAPVPAPSATPAPAPAPAGIAVSSVTAGSAIGADKKVTVATDSFAPTDTMYVSVDTIGSGTANLNAKWTYRKGSNVAVVREDTMTIDASGPATHEFHVNKPDGWPVGTSSLITGPGGSGKPLIGNAVVAAWLRQGGSVVFMSLQYPSSDFISESLQKVSGLTLSEYVHHFVVLELDAEMEGMEILARDRIRANLVNPDIWETAVEEALSTLPESGPGPLIFGSALNLLLFSPTYGHAILETMKRTLRGTGNRSCLFSVSSSAKREMISELEGTADNLLESHSTRDPFRLFLRIRRMKGVPASTEEVEVPIGPATLEEVKKVADHSRKRDIPLISRI